MCHICLFSTIHVFLIHSLLIISIIQPRDVHLPSGRIQTTVIMWQKREGQESPTIKIFNVKRHLRVVSRNDIALEDREQGRQSIKARLKCYTQPVVSTRALHNTFPSEIVLRWGTRSFIDRCRATGWSLSQTITRQQLLFARRYFSLRFI